MLQNLCREGAGTDACAGRPRDYGQSWQPQGKSHSPGDPIGRRQAVLPSQIFARSEPDRTSLRQIEASVAQGGGAHARSPHHRHRATSRNLHHQGMRQLLHKRRIWTNLKASRSSDALLRAPRRRRLSTTNYSLVSLEMMAMSNRADRLPQRVKLLLRQAQMVAPSSFVFNLRIAQVLIEVRPR